MKDLLKDSNLRWTKQRQLIFDEICKGSGHYTAEGVWESLNKKGIHIGLSTVYRTLQLLVDKKKLKQIPLGGETAVFECIEKKGHGHHHVVCIKCNRTVELHVDKLDEIEKLIQEQYGFKILGHSVVFNGLSPDCMEEVSDDGE
jgi:Fur family ferric uptake transcriptional regulator